jgi:hypothetical protein
MFAAGNDRVDSSKSQFTTRGGAPIGVTHSALGHSAPARLET